MLKTKKGRTKLKGTYFESLTDFSMIVQTMLKMLEDAHGSREEAIKALDKAYETGKLTREEVKAKVEEILAKKAEGGEADE